MEVLVSQAIEEVSLEGAEGIWAYHLDGLGGPLASASGDRRSNFISAMLACTVCSCLSASCDRCFFSSSRMFRASIVAVPGGKSANCGGTD